MQLSQNVTLNDYTNFNDKTRVLIDIMESETVIIEIKSDESFVTITEAAKCSIYSKKQIQKLAEKGNQRIRTIEADGHILYSKTDILKYASSHPRNTILDTVWDEIDYIPGECFYPLFGYDNKYFVSNKQRVINCSNGRLLTPIFKKNIKGEDTDYRQVSLRKDGKTKGELLHRLVGITQCPNALNKSIFHHINVCHPANDDPKNLLAVWLWQHTELHRLMRANKTAEYYKMVKAIEEENLGVA